MSRRVLPGLMAVLAAMSLLLFLLGLYGDGRRQYLMYRYPVAYADEIAESAAQYRLNPYLVIAVIRCESSFRADAVSGVGATGLMQIMPATGAWIAEEQGLADVYDESWLAVPERNIALGCWYLRYLADLFDGDFKKIVCAYNAGQGSVAKWLANPAYAVNGALIEIPFPATAAYYENVETAYRQYMAIYPHLFTQNAAEVVEVKTGCYNVVSEEMPC